MAINYWCINRKEGSTCTTCDSKGMFRSNDRDEEWMCEIDPTIKTKIMGESSFMVMGEKMTPQQVQKERKERSSAHFKKDILPTLGTAEKLHHAMKPKPKK